MGLAAQAQDMTLMVFPFNFPSGEQLLLENLSPSLEGQPQPAYQGKPEVLTALPPAFLLLKSISDTR